MSEAEATGCTATSARTSADVKDETIGPMMTSPSVDNDTTAPAAASGAAAGSARTGGEPENTAPQPSSNEADIAASARSDTSTGTGSGNGSPDPLSQVDTALLSALRDARMRTGLLKLERVLVSFMKERGVGYIEVGGPNNCIVIAGQSGGTTTTTTTTGAGNGEAKQVTPPPPAPQSVESPGAGRNGANTAGTSSIIEGTWPAGQPFPTARQTSFQRLCLHRLADRFNIVREAASTPLPIPENERGPGMFIPTLIRLVKTKESRIPPVLLIDLNVASNAPGQQQHQHYYYQQQQYQHQQQRMYSRVDGSHGSEDRSLTEGMSAASLHDHAPQDASGTDPSPAQLAQKQPPPPKKMMIMKRSSSKLSSTGSLNDDGKGGGRHRGRGGDGKKSLKGKDMDERERAYEEARARIFGKEEKKEAGDDENVTADEAQQQQQQQSKKSTSCGTSPNTEKKTTAAANLDVSAPVFTPQFAPSAVSTPDGTPPRQINKPREPGKVGSGNGNSNAAADGDGGSSGTGSTNNDPGGSGEPSSKDESASAGAGVTSSKVTWRNRKEEESDPDFRRGGSMRVVPIPVTAVPPAAATIGGGGAAYYGQQQAAMGARPGYYPQTGHVQNAGYHAQQQQYYGGRGYNRQGGHGQQQPPYHHQQYGSAGYQQQPPQQQHNNDTNKDQSETTGTGGPEPTAPAPVYVPASETVDTKNMDAFPSLG